MTSCSAYASAESLYLEGIINFGADAETTFTILFKKVEKDPYNCYQHYAFHLAICFLHGYGIKKDLAIACSLLTLASDKKNASASYLLALIYKTLKSGSSYAHLSYREYLIKAAQQGHAIAQMDLGDYYHASTDPFDARRARNYYEMSAARGYSPAIKALRNMEKSRSA